MYHSLADLSNTGGEEEAILNAVKAIKDALGEEPATKGESRGPGERIYISPPLVALFRVHWRLNEVLIGKVWAIQRKDKGE